GCGRRRVLRIVVPGKRVPVADAVLKPRVFEGSPVAPVDGNPCRAHARGPENLDLIGVGRHLPAQCSAAVPSLHSQLCDRWGAGVVLEREGAGTARVAGPVAAEAGHRGAWVVGAEIANHGGGGDLGGGVVSWKTAF